MKVVVIGSTGQLGSYLLSEAPQKWEIIGLSHADIEVKDYWEVRELLEEIKPDIVINTAAYHNVEKCEENPEEAYAVNAFGARNVATVCELMRCTVVYISTDYVFDGEKESPYIEYDQPNPLSVYGKSKLAGEYETKMVNERHYIVRTSWFFGKSGSRSKKGNFVLTMLKLSSERNEIRVVNDQVGSPTYTKYLARQIYELLKKGVPYGTYHVSNQGETSWYGFANRIFEISGKEVKVVPISSDEFPSKVRRPKRSVLDNFNLKLLGLDIMPHWEEALKEYLVEIGVI